MFKQALTVAAALFSLSGCAALDAAYDRRVAALEPCYSLCREHLDDFAQAVKYDGNRCYCSVEGRSSGNNLAPAEHERFRDAWIVYSPAPPAEPPPLSDEIRTARR